jgi:hypothetical protein
MALLDLAEIGLTCESGLSTFENNLQNLIMEM